MKDGNLHRLLTLSLAVLALFAASSEASVMCGVFQGAQCETPLYYMKFCADITFRQGYCEDLCQRQQPICNVEDFSPWVAAYQDIGRKGIRGELQNHANEFDEFGTLSYLSEKTVTVCRRTSSGWRPLPDHAPKTCPKAKAASATTCMAGTVFDSARGSCVVQDSAGASGTKDYQNLINQSGMLVATQNQHFGEIASTDTNLSVHSILSDTTPAGLVKDTVSNTGAIDLSQVAGHFKSANSAGGPKGSAASTSTSSGGASLPEAAVNGVNADQVFGSVKKSIPTEAKDSYRTASVQGSAGGAERAESSTSWSGSAKPATAGSASEEVGYAKATGEPLSIEDPANYFMMSDIEVSLFKRVTDQCRRKEKELVLSSGL